MDVRQRAVNYLNIKPRTCMQVKKYLAGKGCSDEEILEAVKELEEYHYIDDRRYCRLYFEYGFEKGRGIARIKRELGEKGISRDIIESEYEELEEVPDQFEMALVIGEDMIRGVDMEALEYEERGKLKAKIGRRLMTRGFSPEVAYKVIGALIK